MTHDPAPRFVTHLVTRDSSDLGNGRAQVMVWFVVFAVDMVYIKFVVDTVPMTNWGRVYYQVGANTALNSPPLVLNLPHVVLNLPLLVLHLPTWS
jgi:predicted ABC-type sugar transport system permease subunit